MAPFSSPRSLWLALAWAAGAASLLHWPALWVGIPFALGSKLFSFTLLTPIVSAYLVYTHPSRGEAPSGPWWPVAIPAAILAVVLVLGSDGWLSPAGKRAVDVQEWLSWRLAAWVATLWALAAFLGGRAAWSALTFPLLYLVTAIPVSPDLEALLEHLLQNGSAHVYEAMIAVTGPSYVRTGTVFQLPGITLEIAPECSGINSSVVLFIVSLVAGYLFLRRPWLRAALTFAVLPLALLRNGFRVWVLTQLCVYDDVAWIHSPLHHQGGPIFFALSLVPFAGLLFWLYRRDRRTA